MLANNFDIDSSLTFRSRDSFRASALTLRHIPRGPARTAACWLSACALVPGEGGPSLCNPSVEHPCLACLTCCALILLATLTTWQHDTEDPHMIIKAKSNSRTTAPAHVARSLHQHETPPLVRKHRLP